jgi:predicted alpha/beta superfamily hydrolase
MAKIRDLSFVARCQTQRAATGLLCLALAACGPADPADQPDAGDAPPQPDANTARSPDAAPPDPTACSPGADGLACLFELWDRAADCEPDVVAALADSFEARRGTLPAWHDGRALFVSYDSAVAVAGAFNDWLDDALITEVVCATQLFAAEAAITSGHYQYKIVDGGAWKLDPENWAYAFDDFGGNPEGVNSVLNTHDSGVGHLVRPPDELCSTELGNCRSFNTYLPAGYGAPANAGHDYPALFMHDGQNIFDDQDCCFGHTGWEINRTLDVEIAAGRVEPVVIVGFDHGYAQRTDEYGYAAAEGGARETFMEFQITQVQPTAAGYWRLDSDRYYTAGSSLGGLVSFALAFTYPDVYRGAASLSGSFWLGEETGTAVGDIAAAVGHKTLALYLDHGGSAGNPADNYTSNLELRDLIVSLGWARDDAPGCTGQDALCYYHDVGATHDEFAWRDRAHHFLRYLFPGE